MGSVRLNTTIDDAGRSAAQLVNNQCAVTTPVPMAVPTTAPTPAADRGAHDRAATGSQAQLCHGPFAVLVGDDIAFSLRLGVGAEGIDDFSVQMIAGAVGQNEFIGTEVDDRPTVQAIAGAGVYHFAVQFRSYRDDDFAVAHDILGDCATGKACPAWWSQHRYPAACEP